jgi:hypothetical protein
MSFDSWPALIVLLVVAIAPLVRDYRRVIGQQVADALETAHVPQKVAALTLGMNEGQFSRALSEGLLTLGDAAYLSKEIPELADLFANLFPGVVTFDAWAQAQRALMRKHGSNRFEVSL